MNAALGLETYTISFIPIYFTSAPFALHRNEEIIKVKITGYM
jgi:hypothetical protein